MSFSKRIKRSVKRAVAYIGDFEETAASVAIHDGYDHVVCGHIHQPCMRRVCTPKGSVNYMNSGDWIEHMTALEYSNGRWRIYVHEEHLAEQASAAVGTARVRPLSVAMPAMA